MFDVNVNIDKVKVGTEHQSSPATSIKGDNSSPIVQVVGNNNSVNVPMPSKENKNKILEMFNMAKEDLEYNGPGINTFLFEEIRKLLAYKGKFSLTAEDVALFRNYIEAASKCNNGNIGSGTNKPGWVSGQKTYLIEILNRYTSAIENDKEL